MAKFGKNEVYDYLEKAGVKFEKIEHEPVYTIEEMQKAGLTERGGVCKNLFLRDAKGKNHFLVVVPEEAKVDLRGLAGKIGSTKLSFGSAERLMKYLGVEQGCVSPLGILNNEDDTVVVVFDKSLAGKEVGVHPNDNTATIWLEFDDLRKVVEGAGNKVLMVQV